MLLPAKTEVARHLERYRAWERVMLAAPTDLTARRNFEDSGYTLCVLMGKRCAREAVEAAQRYLRSNLVMYLRENGQSQQRHMGRRGPPTGRRPWPGGRTSGR